MHVSLVLLGVTEDLALSTRNSKYTNGLSMMRMIFFNIGWMEHYQGITSTDPLDGGGKFPDENGYGYEIFNFLPFNGYMYGYVQPSGKGDYFDRTINIDNLDAPKNDFVDNVLSVWLASNPDKSGTRVIGWYKNSTVYRKYQPAPSGSNRTFKDPRSSFGYCVTAKAENCVCLPIEERTIRVSRMKKGGLGRSNVWFADAQEEITLNCRRDVEELVSRYQASEITQLSSIRQEMEQGDFFDPNTLEDARERVLTSIVRRQGQSQFRQQLLKAYIGKCAISGSNVEQALEAAHIISYRGPETNITSNGLLLRADLHTLFDLNLITIDPQTMKVLVAPKLMQTDCRAFYKKEITLPKDQKDRPDKIAIEKHYEQCKWTK